MYSVFRSSPVETSIVVRASRLRIRVLRAHHVQPTTSSGGQHSQISPAFPGAAAHGRYCKQLHTVARYKCRVPTGELGGEMIDSKWFVSLICGGVIVCLPASAGEGTLASDNASPSIDQLLDEFEHARCFWEQREVGERLVATGRRRIIRKMEPLLANPERMRKCNAAYVMARLGDCRGVDIIIHELEDTSTDRAMIEESLPLNPSIERQISQDRYYAALLLGRLGDNKPLPALFRAIQDAESGVRMRAATSLGEIGDPAAIPKLEEMIDTFPGERLWAGYGLAMLGQESGFKILTATALNDPNWTDRRHAIEALATIARSSTRCDVCGTVTRRVGGRTWCGAGLPSDVPQHEGRQSTNLSRDIRIHF